MSILALSQEIYSQFPEYLKILLICPSTKCAINRFDSAEVFVGI
jgi:hypothetical protein